MQPFRLFVTSAWRTGLAACLLAAVAGPLRAYESDVHFGLTLWLARQAGFPPGQATAIAAGNQRMDSGLIATMELSLEHACVGGFAEAAAEVQGRHYPSLRSVPARPEERPVVAGSVAARKPLADLLPLLAGKEGLMLAKFGEALHTLQDSWSNAGVPGIPAPGAGITCDPLTVSTHPPGRGGAHPHGAALTFSHPADVVAMALASYQALLAFPPVAGQVRPSQPWARLAPLVEGFARARSKTEKRDWFAGQGIADTGFLWGTSLPDGPRPGPLVFPGALLPPLKTATSSQYDAAPELKAFFDELFVRWLGVESADAVVATLGADAAASTARGAADPRRRELAARLTLWKLRDHGAAAVLAHARAPLTPKQLREVQRLAREPGAFVQPDELRDAFFPLLPKSPHATPLMPYVIRTLPPAPGGSARSIAITRLRHAPYDTLGFVAQRGSRGWVLVDFVFAVDQ